MDIACICIRNRIPPDSRITRRNQHETWRGMTGRRGGTTVPNEFVGTRSSELHLVLPRYNMLNSTVARITDLLRDPSTIHHMQLDVNHH